MPRPERLARRPAPSAPPTAGTTGVLTGVVCLLAVFGLAGGLVLAGLGKPAVPIIGILARFLFVFLGSGLLVAAVIDGVYERRRQEGPWS